MGWSVTVYRQANGGRSPATDGSVAGAPVAEWETGLFGLQAIREHVKAGRVIDLGFEGLLQRFTGPAECVAPQLFVGVEPAAAAAPDGVRRGEWLLVHAWDMS
jgi:hypothetical protein